MTTPDTYSGPSADDGYTPLTNSLTCKKSPGLYQTGRAYHTHRKDETDSIHVGAKRMPI